MITGCYIKYFNPVRQVAPLTPISSEAKWRRRVNKNIDFLKQVLVLTKLNSNIECLNVQYYRKMIDNHKYSYNKQQQDI